MTLNGFVENFGPMVESVCLALLAVLGAWPDMERMPTAPDHFGPEDFFVGPPDFFADP